MTKRRHTPEEIARILEQIDKAVDAGAVVGNVCRDVGISSATYYLWRKRYGRMKPDQLKLLKDLEKENANLARELDEITLDNAILKEAWRLGIHEVDSAERQGIIRRIEKELGISRRRACATLWPSRYVDRHSLQPHDADRLLIEAMVRLSSEHPSYGYRRIAALLRGEGWSVNNKRVYRLWREAKSRASSAPVDRPEGPPRT